MRNIFKKAERSYRTREGRNKTHQLKSHSISLIVQQKSPMKKPLVIHHGEAKCTTLSHKRGSNRNYMDYSAIPFKLIQHMTTQAEYQQGFLPTLFLPQPIYMQAILIAPNFLYRFNLKRTEQSR